MKRWARAIRDIPEIKLVGRQLGPLAKGQKLELEPWEEAVLRRYGFVEPLQEFGVTEVRRLLLAEEREPGPARLPADFYAVVAQQVECLRSAGELEEFRGLILALAEVRIPKLLRLALSPSDARELPPEERFLVNRLAAVLNEFGGRLKRLLEGGAGEEAEMHGIGKPV